uniref:AAA family ATPase n=1 Tax=Hydrogenimonas sp. TaxID=2231112 RepID=UPI00260B4383
MRRRNRNRTFTLETPETPMIRKIVATLLLRFNALPLFVNEHGFCRDSLAQLLGVAHLEEDVLEDRREVIEAVRAVCAQTLKEPADYPETLETNLARLRRIVDLKDLEADLLRFAILLHYSPELDDLFDLFEPLHTARAQMLLAAVLDTDYRSLGRILSPRGTLARSGLLGVDRNFGGNSMRGKLDLLSSGFADMMMSYEGEDLYEIFKEAVRRVSAPSLNLEDFSHMAKERSLMLRYMQKAAATRKTGAHILLYGPPGTGKTEWVKTMASAMDLRLFEISYADEDDEPLNGRNRINAFKSAQYLFSGKKVLLMFDEIEDIFEEINPISSLFGQKPTQSRKGWFNRILENAPVPTVWISNSIAMMDEAMLRRFDLVVRMPVPPQSKRLQIAKEAFGKRVEEPTLRAMAEHPAAAPAVLSRAAEVLALIDPDKKEADTYALSIVSATLEAQGYRPLKKATRMVTGAYDPQLVNCDADLAEIADGIARNPAARLCIYGPPGTGKSAFGKWL